jgi:L-fuconolactonase
MDDMTAIVDSHVHFWDPETLTYPWLKANPTLSRSFLLNDYADATADIPVESLVVVEANPAPSDARREALWLDSLATVDSRIRAIVAYVAVDGSGRDDAFDALSAIPRVKGLRHNIQGESSGFCLRPAFIYGVRTAGRRGFSFDICATHNQLGEVVELVTRCPDTRFVLDHCGKPAIRDGLFEPWTRHVRALAERGNVTCKLSGLLTEAAPQCSDNDLIPYAEHVVSCFGTDRMMYGSDWPVLTVAGEYSRWFAFTQKFTSGWTSNERHAFYVGNAFHTYGIGDPQPSTLDPRPS